ncbi:MAG: hypothetical protein JWQ27_2528 [Ferruginibacter sp.]|nr:hypothetical protein [Ferruginibacter sp.]
MMRPINYVKGILQNKSARSVGTYIFTNFFAKGISFLLIPLFTNPKYLTPADNGLLSLFNSNMVLLAPFVSLGMIQSSTADYYKKTKGDFANAFTTNFFIAAFMALFAALCLFLFRSSLQEKFNFPPSFALLLPLLAFLIFSGEQLFGLLRNRNEVRKFAITGISKSIVEYAVAVVLMVFLLWGWKARIWGIAVSLLVLNLFAFYYYARNGYLHFAFRKKQVWEELKFGAPIFVFQLCVFMLGTSNKLFLAIFDVDKAELGIYSIACVLGTLVGIMSQSILLYVQPKLYGSISRGEATLLSIRKDFFRYFKMLTAVGILCLGVGVFAYYFLINPIYLAGMKYFFIVALSSYLWGLNYFFFLFLLYYKEKQKILRVAGISVCCSILVNVIMVKNFGIMGDALASLINTVIFSGLIFIFIRKTIRTTDGVHLVRGIVVTDPLSAGIK